MTLLLIGLSANGMKYPVTAFPTWKVAWDTIADAGLQMKDEDLIVVDSVSDARAVADIMWDSYYFVGDPPMAYKLINTREELGILSVSDD